MYSMKHTMIAEARGMNNMSDIYNEYADMVAELAAAKTEIEKHGEAHILARDEIYRLESENNRLREALENIANNPSLICFHSDSAQSALDGGMTVGDIPVKLDPTMKPGEWRLDGGKA